jgi:uncharacterized protein YccT (UPF0319 family)
MKSIDCIKFKRETAQRVSAKISEMSTEQQLEYWYKRFNELNDRMSRIREQRQLYGNNTSNSNS